MGGERRRAARRPRSPAARPQLFRPPGSGQDRQYVAACASRGRRSAERYAQEPVPRSQRRVCRASRVRARGRNSPYRLESVRQVRPLFHQGVRRGNEPAGLPAARCQRLDGLCRGRVGATQVRLRRDAGRLAGLSDAATGRRGGAGDVQHRAAALYPATQRHAAFAGTGRTPGKRAAAGRDAPW